MIVITAIHTLIRRIRKKLKVIPEYFTVDERGYINLRSSAVF